MSRVVLSFIVVLLFCGVVHAGDMPEPLKFLENEPVTLLDLGLSRSEAYLKESLGVVEIEDFGGSLLITTTYDESFMVVRMLITCQWDAGTPKFGDGSVVRSSDALTIVSAIHKRVSDEYFVSEILNCFKHRGVANGEEQYVTLDWMKDLVIYTVSCRYEDFSGKLQQVVMQFNLKGTVKTLLDSSHLEN